jgi:hypothetical protein
MLTAPPLDIEDLAREHARIAHAVDEDVVPRLEAANIKAVAEGIAALARAQRDAGLGAQHIAEARGAHILEQLLGEHRDRLRHIHDLFGEFAIGRVVDLVGRSRIGIGVGVGAAALDLHLGQRHRARIRGRRGLIFGKGTGGQRRAGERDARAEQLGFTHAALDAPQRRVGPNGHEIPPRQTSRANRPGSLDGFIANGSQ